MTENSSLEERDTLNTQPNGDILFSASEVMSLSRVVAACHDAISSLVSDGDFLGWDNYRALQMWDAILHGHDNYDLEDFVDLSQRKNAPRTLLEWLRAYGKNSRKRS